MANYNLKSVGLSGRIHLQTDPRPLDNTAHRSYSVEGTALLPSRPDGINDQMGKIVGLNDRHAAVTVPGYNEVVMYRRINDHWYYETTITAPYPDEEFGFSVGLAGNRLAIGAPAANGNQGLVYTYEYKEGWRSVMDGVLTADNSNVEVDGRFGEYVHFVGSTLAVGAPNAVGGGTGGVRRGAIYFYTYWVYRRYWQSLGHVSPPSGQNASGFGRNFFLADENTLIAGAPFETVSTVAGAGSVHMWARNYNSTTATTTWRYITKFTAPTPEAGAHFGTCVNLKGKRMLIGEPDNSQGGSTYLYTGYGDVWTLQQTLTVRTSGGTLTDATVTMSDRQGAMLEQEVALNTIMIAAPGYNEGRGVVWVFELTLAGNWIPSSTPRITDDALFSGSNFGLAMASDENDLWIAAPNADTNRGRVYIFKGTSV